MVEKKVYGLLFPELPFQEQTLPHQIAMFSEHSSFGKSAALKKRDEGQAHCRWVMGLLTSASFLAKKDLLSQYSIVFYAVAIDMVHLVPFCRFFTACMNVADMLRYSKPLFGERRVKRFPRMPP
jgi:hypothetical protein